MPILMEDSKELTFDNFDACTHYELFLYGKKADIGGGTITKEEIDILQEYPQAKRIAVMGLHQDTFEYFVKKYGQQFNAIHFWKNKQVHDLSVLGELENIEVIAYFLNHKTEQLWDMSNNKKLRLLNIDDFSRLHNLNGIETAPSLKEYSLEIRYGLELRLIASHSAFHLIFVGLIIMQQYLMSILFVCYSFLNSKH